MDEVSLSYTQVYMVYIFICHADILEYLISENL